MKKTYVKPTAQALHCEGAQILDGSDGNTQSMGTLVDTGGLTGPVFVKEDKSKSFWE